MEKKNRCKNCKHWNKTDAKDWELERYGDAEHRGECHNDKFVYTGAGDHIDKDGLGYSDHEGYNASFYTGKNFGCIHFEEV